MNNSKFMALAIVLVAALSAAAGVAVWKATATTGPGEQATLLVLPEPREIPEFSLVDQFETEFGKSRLMGRWSLLFFGFTHCPDICPGTLYDLHKLNVELGGPGEFETPYQVVFVSVDPERDTPGQLKDYTAYFDPDFVAVTGPHSELQPLTIKLGIAYRIEEHESGAEMYNVDHSASILLLDPEGRLHGVFPSPHDVPAMARELRRLIKE